MSRRAVGRSNERVEGHKRTHPAGLERHARVHDRAGDAGGVPERRSGDQCGRRGLGRVLRTARPDLSVPAGADQLPTRRWVHRRGNKAVRQQKPAARDLQLRRNRQRGTTSITVDWATERSSLATRIQVCIDPGEQLRPRTNLIGGDGRAATVNWLRTNNETDFNATAIELRNQVLEQAASCDGVPIEPRWTPLPPYLADEFSPERISGATLLIDRFGGSQPTVAPAPAPAVAPVDTEPASPSEPAAVAAQATTDPDAATAGEVESAAGQVRGRHCSVRAEELGPVRCSASSAS